MHRFAFARAAAWLEPRTAALLVYLVARLTLHSAPAKRATTTAPSSPLDPWATDTRAAQQAPSPRALVRGHVRFAGDDDEDVRELLCDVAFDELGDFLCDHPEAWALALAVSAVPSAAPNALVRGTRTLRRLHHVAQRRCTRRAPRDPRAAQAPGGCI